jgi:RNA polymerase sigma-70 factor (ECF subfamily)
MYGQVPRPDHIFDPIRAAARMLRMLNAVASPARYGQTLPRPLVAVEAICVGGKTGLTPPTVAALSDQTLWMLAVRDCRDREAFGRLFDHYAPRLKAMVMRAGVGSAQAEDIAQDVMLAVWQKAGQFDPARSQVSGWIYRIARNRQIDLARRLAIPLPEELPPEGGLSDDPSQILAMDQEARKLRAAVERLKPDQKQMIEKAYLGELSHSEIREVTGLPLGTIKSRIRLGLDRLRHELKGLRQT